MSKDNFIDAPASIFSAYVANTQIAASLYRRRSEAVSDYWKQIFSAVTQPAQTADIQMNYWQRMIDDYSDAAAQLITATASSDRTRSTVSA